LARSIASSSVAPSSMTARTGGLRTRRLFNNLHADSSGEPLVHLGADDQDNWRKNKSREVMAIPALSSSGSSSSDLESDSDVVDTNWRWAPRGVQSRQVDAYFAQCVQGSQLSGSGSGSTADSQGQRQPLHKAVLSPSALPLPPSSIKDFDDKSVDSSRKANAGDHEDPGSDSHDSDVGEDVPIRARVVRGISDGFTSLEEGFDSDDLDEASCSHVSEPPDAKFENFEPDDLSNFAGIVQGTELNAHSACVEQAVGSDWNFGLKGQLQPTDEAISSPRAFSKPLPDVVGIHADSIGIADPASESDQELLSLSTGKLGGADARPVKTASVQRQLGHPQPLDQAIVSSGAGEVSPAPLDAWLEKFLAKHLHRSAGTVKRRNIKQDRHAGGAEGNFDVQQKHDPTREHFEPECRLEAKTRDCKP